MEVLACSAFLVSTKHAPFLLHKSQCIITTIQMEKKHDVLWNYITDKWKLQQVNGVKNAIDKFHRPSDNWKKSRRFLVDRKELFPSLTLSWSLPRPECM